MKRLHQDLDTSDDSFSYTVIGEISPLYRVDSSGYLTSHGKDIGKFKLGGDNQWHLYIGDELFMSSPRKSLFMLPEFEMESLTALINLEVKP